MLCLFTEWQHHVLNVHKCILLKMSTWGSKHVEENTILWINNNQCIKLVVNIQSALAALDFTYYNQENWHMHAIKLCYLPFEVLCSVEWCLITRSKETSSVSANFLNVSPIFDRLYGVLDQHSSGWLLQEGTKLLIVARGVNNSTVLICREDGEISIHPQCTECLPECAACVWWSYW